MPAEPDKLWVTGDRVALVKTRSPLPDALLPALLGRDLSRLKICPICDGLFIALDHRKRACSNRCRQKKFYERNSQAIIEAKLKKYHENRKSKRAAQRASRSSAKTLNAISELPHEIRADPTAMRALRAIATKPLSTAGVVEELKLSDETLKRTAQRSSRSSAKTAVSAALDLCLRYGLVTKLKDGKWTVEKRLPGINWGKIWY